MTERPNSGAWDVLAGVRFMLAMIVAAQHIDITGRLNPVFAHVAELSAYTAVVGFLILSGFSIHASLDRDSTGFYRRRLLRIYPLYVLAVGCGCVPEYMHHTLRPHLLNAAAHLLFLQTFTTPYELYNGALWTLAIEVGFYLIAPLLARTPTLILVAAAGVSALVYAAYPWNYAYTYYADLRHGGAMLSLGWAWLAGFVYYRRRGEPTAGVILVGVVIGLTTINQLFTARYQHLTLIATLLPLVLSDRLTLPGPARRILAYGGQISYPFYLLHMPLFHVLAPWNHLLGQTTILGIAMALSCLAAVADEWFKPRVGWVADFVAVRLGFAPSIRPIERSHSV